MAPAGHRDCAAPPPDNRRPALRLSRSLLEGASLYAFGHSRSSETAERSMRRNRFVAAVITNFDYTSAFMSWRPKIEAG